MDEKLKKKELKKAYKQAKKKTIRPWKGLTFLSAPLALILAAVFIFLTVFDNTVAAFVGGTFWELENEDASANYFTSDFETAEEMIAYGTELCQTVEAEGAVLLMNENNALPLSEGDKVSTLSSSSVDLVYGGTGSGNVDASLADDLKTALESPVCPSTPLCGTSICPVRAPVIAAAPVPVRAPFWPVMPLSLRFPWKSTLRT